MSMLRMLFRGLFGEVRWAPPGWLLRTGASFRALNSLRRTRPQRFWSILGGGILLVAAVCAGWLWYVTRPQPQYVTVSVLPPGATPLYGDDAGKPQPLTIGFSAAAAPLEQIGKMVKSGLTITPPIAGTWTWQSDTTLQLQPEADWEIGRDYRVAFEPALFAPHVRLARYELSFPSPRFGQRTKAIQFYEHPTDAKLKKVVATIEFTHPVSKADFERRITFRMKVDPVESFDDARAQAFGFKVNYDDVGGMAHVHSDIVAIPERDGQMQLTVAPGVTADRGGQGTAAPLVESVPIPGLERYFRITSAALRVVTNDRHEMQRVLAIEASAAMTTGALQAVTEVWELPANRPSIGDQPAIKDYPWQSDREVVPEVLALAKRVAVDWIPTEEAFSKLQSARLTTDPGAFLFLRIRRGLRSFGDFPLAHDYTSLQRAPDFPREVKMLYDGALLSLSGEKKLSVLVRNLDAVRFELRRLVPNSVAHLLSQSSPMSSFQRPAFHRYWSSFDLDNIAEGFSEVRAVPRGTPGSSQYTAFDFGAFVRAEDPPRGLFVLKVNGWNAAAKEAHEDVSDERLVLVTDLGMLVKNLEDGSHDVFVQSIRTGEPVAGARVEVLGKNGIAALAGLTDANGHAHFPPLADLKRERTPVAFVAQLGGDYTFLPYGRRDRRVDLSRFDVGGIYAEAGERGLHAYLFSDRGVYRPGEPVHLGIIVRRLDWQPLPAGLPLELALTDPRGMEIRRETIKFGPDGLAPYSFTSEANGPTGSYQASLYVVADRAARTLLGSVRVKIEEFVPDQLALRAELSAPPRPGWISPADLGCAFELKNLFGTPSVGGTIKAQLQLSASIPSFPQYADYHFHDPFAAKKSYDETLAETTTGEEGRAEVDLQLDRFERATYRLIIKAEGTGPGKGRSVAATTSAVVSPLPYLIGWKADGDLGFIQRDSRRAIELIAVDADLRRTDAPDLRAEWLAITYSSVLTKQPNGTLAYQSIKRERVERTEPIIVTATGSTLALPTGNAGSYALVIRDDSGTELSRVSFDVVGEANASRSLERSGELRIKLDKSDYAAGEEIQVAIQAPYAGAGLITIERDRVYATKWFRTATNATVERITVPTDLEGNGYVTVSFVRALDSPEIFTSPLSSGAVPFSVSRARRTQRIELNAPAKIEPGGTLRIGYQTGRPARVMVWAVDEGILQVARYRTPGPLDHFFRKRALEVETLQILDLILPEYSLGETQAAPGGDDDLLAFGAKNPFKRRGLPPAAFWSGVIETDGAPGEVSYAVPDHFNGTMRVLAMAVTADAIGVAERSTIVRGAFVVEPTVPYALAPGDEAEATVLVANTGDAPLGGDTVNVSLETGGGLEIVGDATRSLVIPAGREVSTTFRLRALPTLGPATLVFRASRGAHVTRSTIDLSIRPASPYVTTVASGRIDGGAGHAELSITRDLYAAERDVDAMASYLPASLTRGLARYLENYPYSCTEQVASRALAALVLRAQPELGGSQTRADATLQRVFATLQARQDIDGGFGAYNAATPGSPFVNVYAAHLLLESTERGVEVPASLYRRAIAGLEALVGRSSTTLSEQRAQAYAIYLLARTGRVTTGQLNALRERAELYNKDLWRRDLGAMFMAATARLLALDKDAETLRRGVRPGVHSPDPASYYDDLIHRAFVLYLTAKHFREDAVSVAGEDLDALADSIAAGNYHSLSSALVLLAFDAYGQAVDLPDGNEIEIGTPSSDGTFVPLALTGSRFPHAPLSSAAKVVRFATQARQTLFYQLVEAGYDAAPPAAPMRKKIEVLRELKDADGHDLTRVTPLTTVHVHVVTRTLDDSVYDVALVDLLPGGFELDLSPGGIADRISLSSGDDLWRPDFIDLREDRVVFYGKVTPSARRFVYRIKPMNRGSYVVPPLYAEGMYDRSVQARSLAGKVEVVD